MLGTACLNVLGLGRDVESHVLLLVSTDVLTDISCFFGQLW